MNVIKTFVNDKRKLVVQGIQTEYNMIAVSHYLYQNNIHRIIIKNNVFKLNILHPYSI